MKRPFIFLCMPITPKSKTKNHVIEYLENERRGFEVGELLIREGFSVYCPANDLHYWLSGKLNLTLEEIYEQDLAVIEHCDALFTLFGWFTSENCIKEVNYARDLAKPIFSNLQIMKGWRDSNAE